MACDGVTPDTLGNETNEYTNYTNETNDPNAPPGQKKRRRRKYEKPAEEIIDKVQRQASNANLSNEMAEDKVKLDPNTELFVKLKLKEWDADSSGCFSREEVAAAMDDLRDAQRAYHGMKWKIMVLFVVLLALVGILIGGVFLVMALTRDVEVSKGASLMAEKKVEGKKQPRKSIVQLTQAKDSESLLDLLEADPGTDQWLVADDRLRDMTEISFKTKNGSFYNLDIAELIRVDSGKNGNNDKVSMLSSPGHQLRLWETAGVLEVKWKSNSMWEAVDVADSRRLDSDDRDADPTEAGNLRSSAPWDFEPPRKLIAKGGRRIGYVPVGHHYRGGGGGSGPCKGRCNVPYHTKESCSKWCKIDDCFDCPGSGGQIETCICDGARGLLTRFSQLLWGGLTLLMILRTSW